ncbi:MAG: hypothetical protein RBS92_04225 [Candidatus Cloacimonadales bacterium]|nr:hypothetical protein [Candidatus Cloacimonadales bacterium]
MKSTNGNPPPLLDPFAGGGAIPLEAQRLGLDAYASDLNPVAVMINKAMIEIPPKFAWQPPVNPEARESLLQMEWKGATGLAEDVRYYGEWMRKRAFEKIGHLYPKVKDELGQERTVIAWIWTRTVKCPNPACGCEMPLASSFELSKKKGKEVYVQPIIEGINISYEVRYGKGAPKPPKTSRGKFKCVVCNTPVDGGYIKSEGSAKHMGVQLMAVVAEGDRGRLYITPDNYQGKAAICPLPVDLPNGELKGKAADQLPLYGYMTFSELFTNRQITALNELCTLLDDVQDQAQTDGCSQEYSQALRVYLAFVIDKIVAYSTSFGLWRSDHESFERIFGRQAIAMVWDYPEVNIMREDFFKNQLESICRCLSNFSSVEASAIQHDAQTDNGLRDIMISTDPPYYDNIAYADLSDFFYVWLRQTLQKVYPDIFRTMLAPKAEELVATPYRFRGSRDKARSFFEEGMLKAFMQINDYAHDEIPVTVYYAYKQSEDDGDSSASTGWETMLSAIIEAGFLITGTWPIRTEQTAALKSNVNALASSIVLVCRKRPDNISLSTRRDFINTLKRELKPALQKLQSSNIAPVDLAQSAIGPGMAVYSRFDKVMEADGTPMSVRSALQIINHELDLYFTEQDGELDSDSRFCIDLYKQYAFDIIKYGNADVLARAKNTSVEKLRTAGILYAEKGMVRLLERDEITKKISTDERIIWLLCQQLTHAMEKGGVNGVANIVADISTSEPDHARALAYRLFQIAERKGWAAEAYAYNSLVVSWPEIQAAVIAQKNKAKQTSMFDIE